MKPEFEALRENIFEIAGNKTAVVYSNECFSTFRLDLPKVQQSIPILKMECALPTDLGNQNITKMVKNSQFQPCEFTVRIHPVVRVE